MLSWDIKAMARCFARWKNFFLTLINEKQPVSDIVEHIIYKKAKAKKEWHDNFKRKSGIYNVLKHRKAVSLKVKIAEAVNVASLQFQKLTVSAVTCCNKFFNYNEIGFLKKVPERVNNKAEENALPNHKPMKHHLILMLVLLQAGISSPRLYIILRMHEPLRNVKHRKASQTLCGGPTAKLGSHIFCLLSASMMFSVLQWRNTI